MNFAYNGRAGAVIPYKSIGYETTGTGSRPRLCPIG
jgi:hypothetical protein